MTSEARASDGAASSGALSPATWEHFWDCLRIPYESVSYHLLLQSASRIKTR